jgi:polyhydroxybutyrate depolymerase
MLVTIATFCALATAHAGPPDPVATPASAEGSIDESGVKRTYHVHVPPGAGNQALPLVVVLHGRGGSGQMVEKVSNMSILADREHFIAVYPDALGKPTVWNAGVNPNITPVAGDDDVKFLTDLVDKMEHDLHVDPKRIYFCGFSSGAIMSYRMGAALSTRLAAIGINSGTIGSKNADGSTNQIPNPSHGLPVIAFHGEKDQTVFYNGGGPLINALPVSASIAFWVAANKCQTTPKSEQLQGGAVVKDVYPGCANKDDVILFTFKNGTHEWPLPGNSDKFPGSAVMWDFFKAHPLP